MLNESMINLDKIPEEAGYVMCVVNKEMVVKGANSLFSGLYRLTPEQVVGRTLYELYPGFDRSVFNEALKKTIATGQSVTRLGYSNNANKILSARALQYGDNFLVIAHEIENTSKFGYVTQYDTLTSIGNRYSLEDELDRKFVDKKTFSLFLIDILKFKSINDSFGVSQGDMILMEFAARLKKLLNKEINAYRYNADQFALIVDSTNQEVINKIITDIQESKKEHYLAQSNHITLDLAIGYCVIENFENSFQEVITHVEIALNKAKKTKNKLAVKFNEKETFFGNKEKLILANEFKKALKENDSIILHYQRQVDTKSTKICGAEALVRWIHPTKGFISPAQFLPVAEEFDLMFDLDKYVFIRAIKDILEMRKKGIELPIAINLSSSSLCNPKIVDLFSTILKRIAINPALITIEITESAFIEEKQISKKIVDDIKALGMNIALDDFCTGYSSMEYLLSYPANYLKIDREFIRKIDEDSQRKKIVKGLITMAQSLNMSVIAEGVETKEEAIALVSLNCNCIQGYLFGKPQRLEDLVSDIEKVGYTKNKGIAKTNNNLVV